MATRQLLYIADPMCSWCYGFSPVITALAERFADQLPLRLMMGGLRAGNTRAMRDQDKEMIRGAWTRVNQASGQPFDFAFFERDGFVYDTEPACRAVVAARAIAPERALALMSAIQRAFYGNNRDMTDTDELTTVAGETGLDREDFRAAFMAPDTRNETFRDFLTAKQMGVEGFPTLVAGSDEGGYALITNGYRPLDGIPEALDRWLAAGAPVTHAQA